MKKQISVLVLSLVMIMSVIFTAEASFTDVSGETAEAAAALYSMGIVNGTGENRFSPDSSLTRAQICAMAIRTMGYEDQVNTYSRKTLFSDVRSSSWYNGYVNLAYAKGIINGYGNGKFGPDDTITYGQLATILLRMLGYTADEIGYIWPMDYTDFFASLGLANGMNLEPYQVLTRSDAAILFYRTLKAPAKNSKNPYYMTVNSTASTKKAIILDNNAQNNSKSGLLMAYVLDAGAEIAYYTQAVAQDDYFLDSMVTLLFNSSGEVVGAIPEGTGFEDIKIAAVSASGITSADGKTYCIPSDAKLIISSETYSYASGYLQLNSKTGSSARLFYDDNSAVSYVCLTGGTSAQSSVAVAATDLAEVSLAQQLGISNKSYTVTKNGVAATSADLALHDVGYYDAALNTLRTSDLKVSGYISAASPSFATAATITVSGHKFEVLECARETLDEFNINDKVTLMLTDDFKVAAVYDGYKFPCEMLGVLSKDGKSVTLAGTGITLSAKTMYYTDTDRGGLVTVSTASESITCKSVSAVSSKELDIASRTLGEIKLAPKCVIYEWAGAGYVCDLEGNALSFSSSFNSINWTNTVSASDISYYHVNSAGQVDVILLNDITGNAYTYGKIEIPTTDEKAIDFNKVSYLTNSSGTSNTRLSWTNHTQNGYVGVSYGQSSNGYVWIAKLQQLQTITNVTAADFYNVEDKWYVKAANAYFPVSDKTEIYVSDAKTWIKGEEALFQVLADDYELTVYYDRSTLEGGKARIIVASPKN